MNTEKIYDEQISPLMTQIIEICRTNGMGLFVHVPLHDEDGEALACTTSFPGKNASDEQNERIKLLATTIYKGQTKKPQFAGVALMKGEDGGYTAEVAHSSGYNPSELEDLKAGLIAKQIQEDQRG